jgi:hypothetical protein
MVCAHRQDPSAGACTKIFDLPASSAYECREGHGHAVVRLSQGAELRGEGGTFEWSTVLPGVVCCDPQLPAQLLAHMESKLAISDHASSSSAQPGQDKYSKKVGS